jgi:hypothetical protein
MIKKLRRAAGVALDARAWRPESAGMLLRDLRPGRTPPGDWPDEGRILAGAAWLARAQDATPDGGISGRYLLGRGWTSSYPETTGYIIPTFLELDGYAGLRGFRERGERAVAFLLDLQLPDGAFPGGEVDENRSQPSVFNTAQILHGLTAWHRDTADATVLASARRAADWLVSIQGPDGAWREHVYGGFATTYTAHASCWLAELAVQIDDAGYAAAARRHLDWVLQQRDPATGWFDLMGFNDGDHRRRVASTHTIAYTLWGVLLTAEWLEHERALTLVRESAERLARAVNTAGTLHGVLDHEWRRQAGYVCLTGNAQMALVWDRLDRHSPDPTLRAAAQLVLDRARGEQVRRTRSPDLHGALAGSAPAWGDYIRLGYPNWAAKFYIDALRTWERLTHAGGAGSQPELRVTK